MSLLCILTLKLFEDEREMVLEVGQISGVILAKGFRFTKLPFLIALMVGV